MSVDSEIFLQDPAGRVKQFRRKNLGLSQIGSASLDNIAKIIFRCLFRYPKIFSFLFSNFTSSMTVGALRVPSGVASFPGTRSGRDRVVRQTATRTGAAADTIAAQFLAGSCRRPGGGGLLSNFNSR